jgi:hypothetical protein
MLDVDRDTNGQKEFPLLHQLAFVTKGFPDLDREEVAIHVALDDADHGVGVLVEDWRSTRTAQSWK